MARKAPSGEGGASLLFASVSLWPIFFGHRSESLSREIDHDRGVVRGLFALAFVAVDESIA